MIIVPIQPAAPSPTPAPYVEVLYVPERAERLPAPIPVEEPKGEQRTVRMAPLELPVREEREIRVCGVLLAPTHAHRSSNALRFPL